MTTDINMMTLDRVTKSRQWSFWIEKFTELSSLVPDLVNSSCLPLTGHTGATGAFGATGILNYYNVMSIIHMYTHV